MGLPHLLTVITPAVVVLGVAMAGTAAVAYVAGPPVAALLSGVLASTAYLADSLPPAWPRSSGPRREQPHRRRRRRRGRRGRTR